MFKWKRSHKTQGGDEKAATLESTFEKVDSSGEYGASEHIELKEEPVYPRTQGTIELKEKKKAPLESTSTNRPQGVFEQEVSREIIEQKVAEKEVFELKPEPSPQVIMPTTSPAAKLDSGDHEKYVLLFDLDGTLFDSIDGIYHSFTHACGAAFSPTIDEVRSLIGLPLVEMFIKVGFEPKEAQDRAIAYKNHYRKIYLQETKLLPNVIESLIMAKSFAHLGVVTTKTALYSKHILQHFDILRFFQVVIGSEDVQHPKPSAEPILKALCSLPIAPKEQVFMIGDTIYDLEAAKNAQINGVWVRSGYGMGLESRAMMSCDGVYEAVCAIRTQAMQYADNWHTLE
ncbi:HAD family hydrolase [Helicobacter zhangjianzhongii]|uniref:HAD family hydrolase n=1 Tax=Helicobacter zhangjianzhongii TaxID=2974574 RepID=UPI002554AF31|nr:HAD family hydrolase [Helicobacter sp. CPD2-1]MDL0080550.1 HAD family hydrolase [Helicobacter sp. CPD2-1]